VSQKKNSEKAEQIQKNLGKLSTSLQEVETSWNTLYTHIKNAYSKASEVNEKHNRQVTFEQITETEEQAATSTTSLLRIRMHGETRTKKGNRGRCLHLRRCYNQHANPFRLYATSYWCFCKIRNIQSSMGNEKKELSESLHPPTDTA